MELKTQIADTVTAMPPSTPLRARPTSGKLLELTPIWESITRYNRFPINYDKTNVFTELTLRLNDPEWEVRQHALRVLNDIIPVVAASCGSEELDSLMVPVVLIDVTQNMGHSAPGLRNSALEVLSTYLKYTTDPEFVVRTVVSTGLESPVASSSLQATVINILPRLLDETESISHQTLVHLVTAVSKNLAQLPFQKQAIETLSKIRDLVGEVRFDHFLESYYPQVKRDLDVLRNVYQTDSDVRDSGIDLQSPPPVANDEEWSETSFSPTRTLPEEIKPEEYDRAESSNPEDSEDGTVQADTGRVILERDVKIDDDNTLTMKLVEENVEDEKKTPRRVHFGGEVVKLRTPDSDGTNEAHDDQNSIVSETKSVENETEKKPFQVIPEAERKRKPRLSHIPIPIAPTLSRPRRRPSDSSPGIPTYDGGDSLTSSSEGEKYSTKDYFHFHQEKDIASLGFLPKEILQALIKKDDWRSRVRALDRLASWATGRLDSEESRRLVQALVGWLSEDPKQPRLVASLIRTARSALVKTPKTALVSLLPWLVPILCRHLAGGAALPIRLEAVEAVKTLMRVTSPGPVIEVLLTDRCISSRSSKLRENSLLCLLYALMTFPSNEFNCTQLAERIIGLAVGEPKRRVRQAMLETLAVLSQFVPRNTFNVEPNDFENPAEAQFFSNALQARLARRQLPAVSHEGLVLYSLQIPAMTGTDADWVLAGSGSLSAGSARSRTQMDLYQQQRYLSQSSENMFNWGRDSYNQNNMMAVGQGLPSRSYENVYNNNFDHSGSLYDQTWPADPRQSHQSSFVQGGTKPMFVTYQTPNDSQRGFPHLNASFTTHYKNGTVNGNGMGPRVDLSQTWSGGGSRWIQQQQFDPPPPNVSIKQTLPPIGGPQAQIQDWRMRRDYPQVENGYRFLAEAPDDFRKGRWSSRRAIPNNNNYRLRVPNGDVAHENGFAGGGGLIHSGEASKSDSALSRSYADFRSSPGAASASAYYHGSGHPLNNSSSLLDGLSSSFSTLDNNSTRELKTSTEGTPKKEMNDDYGTPPLSNSVSSSLASVNSQPQLEQIDKGNESGSHVLESKEEKNENDEMLKESTTTEEPVNEAKSVGTPNSEPGSESSRNTEITSKSQESLGSGKEDGSKVRRIPRAALGLKGKVRTNGTLKEVKSCSLYPQSLPAFENPKDALAKSMLQLENPEWEVVMQGLQGIVRLARHHPKYLQGSIHPLVVIITKHIKNLRSQVSRGACQCSAELFTSLGRSMDSEVDDIVGALLSRSADTNKFIRADSSAALEEMVDHTSPSKSVAALVGNGARHQNAVMRGVTSRLLLRLISQLGCEKTMALPKDLRDTILVTAAKFLTEGSLETRRYAKEIFTVLRSDSKLYSILSDIVPGNLMRSIQKVLSRLNSTQ